MSDMTTAPIGVGALDPQKRLRYSLGLILGEDELAQEQFYFLERGRLHNRALHGYGTVSGLDLKIPEGQPTKVTVTPGLAVDPFGREIRVNPAQCADIMEWLDAQNFEKTPRVLYVLLSYKECETDKMPVPGAACRSAAESLVPSRITETFNLTFSTTHPNQAEEEMIQAFVRFLSQIDVTTGAPETSTSTLVTAMRAAVKSSGDLVLHRAASEPDRMETVEMVPPPIDDGGGNPGPVPPRPYPHRFGYVLSPEHAPDVFRELLRIWVTEIRPTITPEASGAVLLGEIDLSESGDALTFEIDQSERPLLVASRVIQEALVHPAQDRTHSELWGLEGDDHKQYLLVNPTNRALIADLNAASHKVTNLATATAAADATRLDQVQAMVETRIKKEPAQRDLSGDYPTLTVVGLQGRTVAPDAPSTGQVLTWNGTKWAPAAPPSGGSGVDIATVAKTLPTMPLVTVRESGGNADLRTFTFWFHLQVDTDPAKANVVELVEAPKIFAWAESSDNEVNPPFLAAIPVMETKLIGRNQMQVICKNQFAGPLVRFVIDMESAKLTGSSGTLLDWASKRPVKWLGHDGNKTVTVFHWLEDLPQAPAGPITVAAVFYDINLGKLQGFGVQRVTPDEGNRYRVLLNDSIPKAYTQDRLFFRLTSKGWYTAVALQADYSAPEVFVYYNAEHPEGFTGFWLEVVAY